MFLMTRNLSHASHNIQVCVCVCGVAGVIVTGGVRGHFGQNCDVIMVLS